MLTSIQYNDLAGHGRAFKDKSNCAANLGHVDGARQRQSAILPFELGLGLARRRQNRPRPDGVVNHQQVVRHRVKPVAIAPAGRGGRVGVGAHLVVEHMVAQRLRGIDLFKAPGVAETIDWAEALVQLDRMTLDPESINDTLGTLLKYQDDIAKIKGSEASRILQEVNAELASAAA